MNTQESCCVTSPSPPRSFKSHQENFRRVLPGRLCQLAQIWWFLLGLCAYVVKLFPFRLFLRSDVWKLAGSARAALCWLYRDAHALSKIGQPCLFGETTLLGRIWNGPRRFWWGFETLPTMAVISSAGPRHTRNMKSLVVTLSYWLTSFFFFTVSTTIAFWVDHHPGWSQNVYYSTTESSPQQMHLEQPRLAPAAAGGNWL